ncbi:hypothetical protein SAMN02745181_0300 [Rubritalea squalenifaciens DSM 18772]|uniref:Uncharacterized protein n=2 Tax=Rubritalea squalenifaciens TaxID=407226 RepID=A0A1M6BSP9_9BACT|nr:hypothetical protein SAMN02745181_0300 [Rubritalea squalenifaciens DSM 18772]
MLSVKPMITKVTSLFLLCFLLLPLANAGEAKVIADNASYTIQERQTDDKAKSLFHITGKVIDAQQGLSYIYEIAKLCDQRGYQYFTFKPEASGKWDEVNFYKTKPKVKAHIFSAKQCLEDFKPLNPKKAEQE